MPSFAAPCRKRVHAFADRELGKFQDIRRRANAVFVLVSNELPRVVLGYFTLCSHGLAPGTIHDEARKLVPRCPLVSATLIGRLAVSKSRQGEGLGTGLLACALRKAQENADVVGSSMVVVDAVDEELGLAG